MLERMINRIRKLRTDLEVKVLSKISWYPEDAVRIALKNEEQMAKDLQNRVQEMVDDKVLKVENK